MNPTHDASPLRGLQSLLRRSGPRMALFLAGGSVAWVVALFVLPLPIALLFQFGMVAPGVYLVAGRWRGSSPASVSTSPADPAPAEPGASEGVFVAASRFPACFARQSERARRLGQPVAIALVAIAEDVPRGTDDQVAAALARIARAGEVIATGGSRPLAMLVTPAADARFERDRILRAATNRLEPPVVESAAVGVRVVHFDFANGVAPAEFAASLLGLGAPARTPQPFTPVAGRPATVRALDPRSIRRQLVSLEDRRLWRARSLPGAPAGRAS